MIRKIVTANGFCCLSNNLYCLLPVYHSDCCTAASARNLLHLYVTPGTMSLQQTQPLLFQSSVAGPERVSGKITVCLVWCLFVCLFVLVPHSSQYFTHSTLRLNCWRESHHTHSPNLLLYSKGIGEVWWLTTHLDAYRISQPRGLGCDWEGPIHR